MSRSNLSRHATLGTTALAPAGLRLTTLAQDKRPPEWAVSMSVGGSADIVSHTVADQIGLKLD